MKQNRLTALFSGLGLRSRFVLMVTLLLSLIFGFFTVFLVRSNTSTLRQNLLDESRSFATLATSPIGNTFSIYKDSGTAEIDRRVREFASLNENVTNIAVVDIDGRLLFSQNDMGVDVSAAEAASFEPVYKETAKGSVAKIVYPYFEASGAHRYSLVYSISDEQIDDQVRREALSWIAFGALALLLTGISIYTLINLLIIRPIESVSRQAAIISAGNLDQQVEVHSNDEIGRLSRAVNTMAESLKRHIVQLKEIDKVKSEFMMITSHNLRTPLTIINGYMENADRYKSDPAKLETILTRIKASVKRLAMFAEDVLAISKFELGEQDKAVDKIDVASFLVKIADEFRLTADNKGVNFTIDARPDDAVQVQASAPHLRSAIWNLLDNAVKFTPKGGSVRLILKSGAGRVLISVEDTGIGIKPEEIPQLFTKFHRGTSTLTYDFEGTGIGLYASKVMIETYGGSIDVESQVGKGSRFTINLPAMPNDNSVPG